jgi:hypothetical protein
MSHVKLKMCSDFGHTPELSGQQQREEWQVTSELLYLQPAPCIQCVEIACLCYKEGGDKEIELIMNKRERTSKLKVPQSGK